MMARLLVIDDDLEFRSMLVEMLRRADYDVVQGSDGRVAMKVLREEPIDIVITDIVMPEKEGLETIKELRREFPEVKIIAMSGGGRIGPRNYLSIAKALGAQRTFEKPIDNDEIKQAIQELLAD